MQAGVLSRFKGCARGWRSEKLCLPFKKYSEMDEVNELVYLHPLRWYVSALAVSGRLTAEAIKGRMNGFGKSTVFHIYEFHERCRRV